MRNPRSRRRAPLLVLGAVALLGAAALFLSSSQPPATKNLATASTGITMALALDEIDPLAAAPSGSVARPPPIRLSGPSAERLTQNLIAYQRAAIYPPWSRAFDPGTEYLLTWNKPATVDLPMDERPGQETTYHFDADRAHVAYGEAITSWIEVWKNGDPNQRMPIVVEDAYVMATTGPKPGRTVKLAYHDDGQDGDAVAGDLRYSNRLVPSKEPDLAQALQVHLMAVVSCCDGIRRSFMREFTYAPRKVLEIVGISDSIRGGNLALTLDVDVAEKGVYGFEANVMSHDGSVAIGFATANQTLGTGRAKVDVIFFGRMFGEKGIDGPYLVRDIRGERVFMDGEEHNIPFTYPSTYTTRAYRRADFSSDEWNSPEKTDKIARMKKLIADANAGRTGPPVPSHIHIDENGVARPVNDPPAAE